MTTPTPIAGDTVDFRKKSKQLGERSKQVEAIKSDLDALYPGRLAFLLVKLDAKGVAEKGAHRGAIARWKTRATPRAVWLRKIALGLARGEKVGLAIPPGVMAIVARGEEAITCLDATLPDAPMVSSTQEAACLVSIPDGVKVRANAELEMAEGIHVELRPGHESEATPIMVEPSPSESGVACTWEREPPEKLERSPTCPGVFLDCESPSIRSASKPKSSNREIGVVKTTYRKESPLPTEVIRETPIEELVTCLHDVEQDRWKWLCEGRFPFGAITGVTGPPGMGKGVAIHDLVAKLSSGQELPDGSTQDKLTTILLTREDNPSKTLKPRLQAAGADLSRIFIWNKAPSADGTLRPPNIVDHLGTLERLIERYQAAVVAVDPLMTFLGVDRNAFSPQEMADAMTRLQERVAEFDVAMFIVNHPPKGTGRTAIERFMGTMSTTGVIRMMFEVRPDPEDPEKRLLAQSKNNLAITAGALSYQIREKFILADDGGEPISTPSVEWLGVQEGVTSQSLDARDREGRVSPRTAKAMDFLGVELARADSPKTGVALGKLIDKAKDKGLSIPALYDGFRELGAVATPKDEFGGIVRWYIPTAEEA